MDANDKATSNVSNSVPEIEMKAYEKTILLNVYCQMRKGVLKTVLEEVEKHDLSVVNCSMVSFDNKAFNITVVAQMEEGFNKNMNDLITILRSAVATINPGCL